MNFKFKFGVVFLTSGILLCAPGFADDSAAAIAAGGLVPRRETRIAMAKEVLQISEKNIVVDYDFRNGSDEDGTVERGKPEMKDTRQLVSFCSPAGAKVEKADASRFRVHLTNFIPTSELHIGFFDVPQGRQAKTVSSKR